MPNGSPLLAVATTWNRPSEGAPAGLAVRTVRFRDALYNQIGGVAGF